MRAMVGAVNLIVCLMRMGMLVEMKGEGTWRN